MQGFQYHRPASLAEAARIVGQFPDTRLLAGGQSMLPAMRLGLMTVGGVVDLAGVAELQGVKVNGKAPDERIVIGAMTTHATVAASKDVQARIPALSALAFGVGDRQVRNRGTIGGSIANNDPAACYPAAVLGLDATVHTNARHIAAGEFFRGLYETALGPGEIVTAVSFPVPRRAAYLKFRQQASRFALVGVFVAQTAQGVRVAVTGAAACVFRVPALEQALARKWAPESCDGIAVPADHLNSDLHGSAEYRAHLIPVLAKRAVAAAG